MEDLFIFIMSFIIIFIIYLIMYFIKRKKGTLNKMKEFDILSSRFNLKRKNMDINKLGLIIILINSLIISITGTVCTMIDIEIIWQLLIAFAMLMSLIIISYTILGKILKRKEEK